jgi:hypothetical protein
MSSLALFAVGTAVTLLVVSALALLVWGAILDGRDERARRAAEDGALEPLPETEPEAPVRALDAA